MQRINWLGSPYKQDMRDKLDRNKENKEALIKVLDDQYDEAIYKNLQLLRWNYDFDRYTDSMKKATNHYMREFRLLFQ